MLSKIPGMKQLASAQNLRSAVRTGGLDHNPMMANLAEELLEAAVAGKPGAGRAAVLTRKKPNKNKKKALRKMKKKSRRKSRK